MPARLLARKLANRHVALAGARAARRAMKSSDPENHVGRPIAIRPLELVTVVAIGGDTLGSPQTSVLINRLCRP